MPTITELAVNIALKGSEKVGKGLADTQKGLGDVASTGLAAKAAIVAMVYGLEQLMNASAKTGTTISNLNALTGVSGKVFQQYGNAARIAGSSANEAYSTIGNIQKIISDMEMNKPPPIGAYILGVDTKTRDPIKFLEQVISGMSRLKNIEVGNNAARTLGFSDNMIALARRKVFDPENLAKVPYYTDQGTKALDRANQAWGRLGLKIEMAMGKFTSRHGAELVGDISKITGSVIRLANAFTNLAEKTKVLLIIGKAAEAIAAVFNIASIGVDDVTGKSDSKDKSALGKDSNLRRLLDFRDVIDNHFTNALNIIDSNKTSYQEASNVDSMIRSVRPIWSQSGGNGKSDVTMNNTFHITESHSPHKTADEVNKMITRAANKLNKVR